MSILIKGMKMPKDCTECRFAYDGRCLANYGRKSKIDITNYCPLIELPPHGDLIDRDAFMKKDVPINGYWDENDGRFHYYPPTYMQAVDDIRAAPTIIEAEEGIE